MIPIMFPLLLAAAPADGALELGLKREITLLVGEHAALSAERERLQTLRAARVSSLQRDIAALEARIVEAAAAEASARAAAAAATPPSSSSAPPEALQAMREALGLLGVKAGAGQREPLIDGLGAALGALEAATTPRRIDTGFFAADGSWQQGTVVAVANVGVAVAAQNVGVAGPLVLSDDGTLQLPSSSSSSSSQLLAREAARAIVKGGPAPWWPVAFPSPEDGAEGGSATGPTRMERLVALGGGAVAMALALAVALALALWQLAEALRRQSAVAAVVGRLVGLVSAGEVSAAAALARTVGGAAGRFLVAVVAVCGRSSPEDEVAALSAEATAALKRPLLVARSVFAVATVVVFVVALVAIDGAVVAAPAAGAARAGLLAGVVPLGVGAVTAVVIIAALAIADVVVGRTRELLEVTALRLLDTEPRS